MLSRCARLVVAGLVTVGTTFGCVSSVAASTPDDAGESDAAQSLAVVNADGGTTSETDGGYVLTLTDVVPRAIWFEDRPARGTGTMPIDELVDVFFDGDPPNAALEVFSEPAAGTVIIVELSNPRYDADQARLEFDARILDDEQIRATGLGDHRERVTGDMPATFGAAALFLDDACMTSDGVALTGMSNITCADASAVIEAWQAAGSPGARAGTASFESGGTDWQMRHLNPTLPALLFRSGDLSQSFTAVVG
jgi:hypothetical protein